jgi:predicted O-linked N-acetylglucosamine transferase (SPINDLY family)
LPAPPKTRQQLAIPEDSFIYLSTQSLFKYLPQHDDIYPRIALEVPDACFVFIGNQSPEVTERFRQRLRQAFKRHDLDADRFCHISPRLNGNDFLSLNLAADVLLDTLEWSGGKTTLEAIGCGLPTVTCPGRFMRGRHAYAMLKMMGLTETIGVDKSAYIQIAIKLANDQRFHSEVKKKLLDSRHKLYGDQVFIDGLEGFYKSIVQQRLSTGNAEYEQTTR